MFNEKPKKIPAEKTDFQLQKQTNLKTRMLNEKPKETDGTQKKET